MDDLAVATHPTAAIKAKKSECLPPPKQPWSGAQGICQCGFPELICSSPAIACNDSTDCPNNCGGLPTCLLPGDLYPTECGDPQDTDCYYEQECECDDGECLPPPQEPWGGAQGTCQCGFPELFCSSPAIACNDSADCPNNCGGLPTCLLPGDLYPTECGDPQNTDCYYEQECACDDGECLPPPQEPWGGAQGICQCGFPELFCSSPPISCNDSADCPNNCGGLPTCLLPGDLYPTECGDPQNTDCYYEQECACE